MDPLDFSDMARIGIRKVLDNPSLRGPHLMQAIGEIDSRHNAESFRLCLRLLTGLDLPEADARAMLAECDRNRDRLETELGRDPGLDVAAADHLQSGRGGKLDPLVELTGREAMPASSPIGSAGDFLGMIEAELERAERFDRSLALALFSPDSGELATLIHRGLSIAREVARDTDSLAPIDPDRLAMLFPCTGEEGARLAAGRLLERLSVMTGTTWSAGISKREDGPGGTPELIRQAALSLSVARSAGGGLVRVHRRERREHTRRRPGRAIIGRVQSTLGSDPVPLSGRVDLEDLSLGGARLVSARDITAGTDVVLALRESTALPRQVALPGRVIRSRSLPDRRGFEAALRFSASEAGRYRLAGILADLSVGRSASREENG